MPSMVPVFLAFARSQPDSIMDSVIDQRKVLEMGQQASESRVVEAV